MKNFLKSEKITYNLMSFTGFRSLILFSLLIEGPKSYKEICDHLLNHPYLHEDISIDTLRVYITSLKRAGCDVKRIREKGDKTSKYVILSNPFELNITSEQLKAIEKVYKNLTKNTDVYELVVLEKFLRKLSGYIKNEDVKAALERNSVFGDINIDLLNELVSRVNKKEQIVISYNSPNSGVKDIEILADKLEYSNGKLYLFGTGFEYKKYGSFLVNRIRVIKEVKLHKTIPADVDSITVRYEIKTEKFEPDENEKLISRDENKITVEITASSDFSVKQRLLSLGSNCKVLSPEGFKTEFKELLKKMKAGYYAA